MEKSDAKVTVSGRVGHITDKDFPELYDKYIVEVGFIDARTKEYVDKPTRFGPFDTREEAKEVLDKEGNILAKIFSEYVKLYTAQKRRNNTNPDLH